MRRTVLAIAAIAANLCAQGAAPAGFTLHLGRAGEVGRDVSAADLQTCRVVTNGETVVATWRGHPELGADFTVTADFRKTPSGWDAGLAWTNLSAKGLFLESVSFPEVEVPHSPKGGILHSRTLGEGVIRRPDWPKLADGTVVVDEPTVEFQFIALVDEAREGRYLAAYDPEFRPKRGVARVVGEKVRLGLRVDLPEDAALTRGGALPYRSEVRSFSGGWFAATQLYKPWARRQANPRRDALRDICLWVWNRGTSDEVVPPVERIAADAGVPVALDWYWWHRHGYDTSYPDFWPPREGVEKFRETIARLHAKGIRTMVYANGLSCDTGASAWRQGAEARVDRNGRADGIAYNVFATNRLAAMCGTAVQFQRRLEDLCDNLAAAGVDGFYLDQVNCCAGEPCWSRMHPHRPGDGLASQKGYEDFLGRIRAAHPGRWIVSEECAEALSGRLDGAITLFGVSSERCGVGVGPEYEAAPAWSAVYHGTMALFGTYSLMDGIPPWDDRWPAERRWAASDERDWTAEFPDQFAVEFARTVAWGNQPTVHALRLKHATEAKFAADYRFVVDTARFYRDHRAYLFDGEMEDPGTLTCATRRVAFAQRSIYSKAGEYRVAVQPALPTVLHGIWRAPDGRCAAILVNWTREPQPYDLVAPSGSAKGVLPPRSWRACALSSRRRFEIILKKAVEPRSL